MTLLLFLDTQGVVSEARVATPSGYESLDAAALRVARVFRFSPAFNRDTKVSVHLLMPILFEARDDLRPETATG